MGVASAAKAISSPAATRAKVAASSLTEVAPAAGLAAALKKASGRAVSVVARIAPVAAVAPPAAMSSSAATLMIWPTRVSLPLTTTSCPAAPFVAASRRSRSAPGTAGLAPSPTPWT